MRRQREITVIRQRGRQTQGQKTKGDHSHKTNREKYTISEDKRNNIMRVQRGRQTQYEKTHGDHNHNTKRQTDKNIRRPKGEHNHKTKRQKDKHDKTKGYHNHSTKGKTDNI